MDPLEQSHIALGGDVDSMKNQLYQLVEAMIVSSKKEDILNTGNCWTDLFLFMHL